MNDEAREDFSPIERTGPSPISSGDSELYELFGVDTHANADTLSQAYVRLRQRHHPDNNPEDPLPQKSSAILTPPTRS